MKIKKILTKLDGMVVDGKIIEAFEKFFHNEVITHDIHNQKTNSKNEKLILLKSFFNDFKKTEDIKLLDSKIKDNVSYSKFRFVFSKESGEMHKWNEVIRRTWKDDMVIEEFYSNESIHDLIKKDKPKEVKTKDVKSKDKKEKKSDDKKTEKASKSEKPKLKIGKTTKSSIKKGVILNNDALKSKVKTDGLKKVDIIKKPNITPAKPAAPAKKVVTKTSAIIVKKENKQAVVKKPDASTVKKVAAPKAIKKDKLTLIEGIGPKIASVLTNNNIKDFKTLSAASETSLNKILEAAGTAYKSHNPSTWAMQAKLAAAGKMEELNTLKSKINNGVLKK